MSWAERRSLEHIARALQEAELAGRPFDGILGFAHGGYMGHRAAALATSGDVRFAHSFRFAMMVEPPASRTQDGVRAGGPPLSAAPAP